MPILEKNQLCLLFSRLKVLWESAVINDYLDEVYPDKKLNSDDPYEKARQKVVLESLWGKVSFLPSQERYQNFALSLAINQ